VTLRQLAQVLSQPWPRLALIWAAALPLPALQFALLDAANSIRHGVLLNPLRHAVTIG
jgi:hypothetical protein